MDAVWDDDEGRSRAVRREGGSDVDDGAGLLNLWLMASANVRTLSPPRCWFADGWFTAEKKSSTLLMVVQLHKNTNYSLPYYFLPSDVILLDTPIILPHSIPLPLVDHIPPPTPFGNTHLSLSMTYHHSFASARFISTPDSLITCLGAYSGGISARLDQFLHVGRIMLHPSPL